MFIYCLKDGDEVIYVGATSDMEQRAAKHRWRWGQQVVLHLLEEVEEDWQGRERHWIEYYRVAGAKLRNERRGGGFIGSFTEEQRQRASEAQRGNQNARGKNLGNQYAARPHTEEAKAKMKESWRLRKLRQKGILT